MREFITRTYLTKRRLKAHSYTYIHILTHEQLKRTHVYLYIYNMKNKYITTITTFIMRLSYKQLTTPSAHPAHTLASQGGLTHIPHTQVRDKHIQEQPDTPDIHRKAGGHRP